MTELIIASQLHIAGVISRFRESGFQVIIMENPTEDNNEPHVRRVPRCLHAEHLAMSEIGTVNFSTSL